MMIKQSKERNILPEIGTLVVTSTKILPEKECYGFFVKEQYIKARKPSTNGVYIGYVPGAGGDIWWIKHEDETIGAYLVNEIFDR